MINEIKIFNNEDFGEIRVTEINNEPMFCLADLCRILGLTVSKVNQRLTEDVRTTHPLETAGGMQQAIFVNEDGLYDVILDSRKSEAKIFRKWITSDVLPTIRKHGGYLTQQKIEEVLSDPDTIIKLASKLKEERAERERLAIDNKEKQKLIEQQTPSVVFTQAVVGSQSSCLIGELAKMIAQHGIKIGEHRLFKWLRKNGYLGTHGERYNVPNQQYVEQGLFTIKKGVRNGNNGVLHTTITTKLTGKGQVYFINKFLKLKENGKLEACLQDIA